MGVSLKPLILAHEVNLRSFQIESPQINVIRATNGTWNFSSIGRVAVSKARAAGEADSGTSKVATPELPDLSVGRILIEDARVVVASLPAQGAPTVYQHVNVTARDFSLSSKFPLQLSASLPTDGSINVSGQVGPINRGDAAKSSADVQISVKRLDPVAAGFLDPTAGL